MKLLAYVMMTAGLLLPAAPSLAHHSFAAEFDANNCREFTGTLTKIDWQNPHGYFYMGTSRMPTARWNPGLSRPTRSSR